jgi:hypothetical protein
VICSTSQTGKILDAHCTYPYSSYDDMAGRYRPYGGDVVAVDWSIADEYGVDMCHWVVNNRRTRGPIQGRHMSLADWLRSLCIKCWGPRGSTPRPLLHLMTLQFLLTNRPTLIPCFIFQCTYI